MLRSKKGRELTARMPKERVLTESDGPFAQQGGRPILPWEVDVTVNALAECWKSDPGEVRRSLGVNLSILLSAVSTKPDS